jgi:LysR family glycine cleavage system transcriptional activator
MNGLLTFEAAARCGNFSKASEELNVTPAAVSRMISRLEGHLDDTLFLRTASGVTLTETGRILFDAISRGFSAIEGALREIQDRRTGIETVTLSVSTGFTTHWMMPRMAKFKQAFPHVELRFQLIMGALTGPVNDVDLGMRFVQGADERHEAWLIMPELLLAICSPSYRDSRKDGHGSMERAAETIINLSAAQPDWSGLFSPTIGGASIDSLIFSDYAIVVQAALLGQGVALGWLNVIAHWLCTGALVPAGENIMVTGRRCHLVRLREKSPRSIVDAVRAWIISELSADLAAIDTQYPSLDLARHLSASA